MNNLIKLKKLLSSHESAKAASHFQNMSFEEQKRALLDDELKSVHHFLKLAYVKADTSNIFLDYNLKHPTKKLSIQDFVTHHGITRENYPNLQAASRGQENPSLTKNKLWDALIHNSITHYEIIKYFEYTQQEFKSFQNPWNVKRTGQSTNILPDGRILDIGGTNGLFFDPGFMKFNDVIVYCPKDKVSIYNYPLDIFFPLDFHTATYIKDKIIICGGSSQASIANKTSKETPLYSLNLKTYKITKIDFKGDNPGWIYKHKADVSPDQNSIIYTGGKYLDEIHGEVENTSVYKFDLLNNTWSILKKPKVYLFSLKRKDGDYLKLQDLRYYISSKQQVDKKLYSNNKLKGLNISLMEKVFSTLFEPPLDHKVLLKPDFILDTEYSFEIDGIKVNYNESYNFIQLAIYGDLEIKKIELLKQDLCNKLSQIEHAECCYV